MDAMKFPGYVAVAGGFLLGVAAAGLGSALVAPVTLSPLNDFKPGVDLTLAHACLRGLLQFPLATLVAGALLGLVAAIATKRVYQRRSTALAMAIGGAGYCLFFFVAALCLQLYLFIIRPLSSGD